MEKLVVAITLHTELVWCLLWYWRVCALTAKCSQKWFTVYFLLSLFSCCFVRCFLVLWKVCLAFSAVVVACPPCAGALEAARQKGRGLGRVGTRWRQTIFVMFFCSDIVSILANTKLFLDQFPTPALMSSYKQYKNNAYKYKSILFWLNFKYQYKLFLLPFWISATYPVM